MFSLVFSFGIGISKLSTWNVILKEDYCIIYQCQAAIIRWLLNHDPSKRPSSKELLQSTLLPPPQMEEAELNEILQSTIANPQSSSYRRIMSALFSQQVSNVTDFTFNMDHKVRGSAGEVWLFVCVCVCTLFSFLILGTGIHFVIFLWNKVWR